MLSTLICITGGGREAYRAAFQSVSELVALLTDKDKDVRELGVARSIVGSVPGPTDASRGRRWRPGRGRRHT